MELKGSANDENSSSAIVIVGSSASMIRTLTVQMKSWARDHKFEESKIKGMWGANQHEEWNSRFLSNPNEDYQIDALLFTHFIQAGLSIETEVYVKKFLLFPLSYIDHGLEYQLSNRLRRPIPAFGYIEPGRKGPDEKNVKALTANYKKITNYAWPAYQVETFAEVECEHRDTIYFHETKWVERSKDQGNFTFEKMESSNVETLKIESEILDHHIECSDGLHKRVYCNLLFRSARIPREVRDVNDEVGEVLFLGCTLRELTLAQRKLGYQKPVQ